MIARPLAWFTLLSLVVAAPAATQARPQTREGFWIGFGFGYGSLGCNDCDRVSGVAGYLKMGGTLSQKVLLGGESNGWARSENGATLTFGTLGPVVYFYPSATGGFYLKGGLGIATIELDLGQFSGNDTGFGSVLGVGYDGRVGRNFSLTPFLNFVGGEFDGGTINMFQLGLGFTWH